MEQKFNNTEYEYISSEEYTVETIAGDEYDYIYNKDDETRVQKCLTEIGFDSLIQKFQDERVDYTVLCELNENDVNYLMANYPLGIRKKFWINYVHWKQRNAINPMQVENKELRLENTLSVLSATSSGDMTHKSVKYIFESTGTGFEFYEAHKNLKQFTSSEQRRLCEIISNYFVENKIKLSRADFARISEEIHDLFPCELAETYYDKSKPSGKLYSKYNYILSIYKKTDELVENKSKKRKLLNAIEESPKNDQQEMFNTIEVNSNEFIKMNFLEMYNEILPHWKNSSKIRRRNICDLKDKGITEILSVYKAYTRVDGYLLINIDFSSWFSNVSFYDKWTQEDATLFYVLKKNIRNQYVQRMFENYELLSDASKCTALILGAHCFLYEGGKNKFSILDSVKSMIFLTKNEQSMKVDIKEWQEKLKHQKLPLQPLIIVFGNDYTALQSNCILLFPGCQFKFGCLIRAIETLLNIYYVFDLEWPLSDRNVYKFLSSYFYGLESNLTPSIKTLSNLLVNSNQN